MTMQITVTLNKLTAWDGNVRKTGADQGIEELAASIATHGLLQPLVVRKAKRGKYAVIAGGRRLAALQLLADQERIDPDHQVPCTLREANGDDREISLAENVIRAPMHPADQFEAYRAIIDDGATVPEVAIRFGVSESSVSKRLRLGRLSPVILTAYRDGQLDLAQTEAFTLSDDHDAQERIFAELAGRHIAPFAIRRALTQGEIPATDKRAQFKLMDGRILSFGDFVESGPHGRLEADRCALTEHFDVFVYERADARLVQIGFQIHHG